MTLRLRSLRWTEIDRPDLLLVPVGSLEQHGPHLPLDTDTRVAAAVADAAAEEIRGLLAPPVGYGASGEHEDFPGTISIGTATLRAMLVEYGRSACRWADRLLLVNAHGGNIGALVGAVQLLRYEGRDAAWWPCVTRTGDAHAGRTETSLMLHVDPAVVRAGAEPGNTQPLAELMPALRTHGVRALSPNGVLGDPTGASAAEGELLLDEMATGLVEAVRRWTPDERGRLV
nr:mycofactocin biosynthesis peptidyl-dipeptidase MftE [Fodinicola acaciae]